MFKSGGKSGKIKDVVLVTLAEYKFAKPWTDGNLI